MSQNNPINFEAGGFGDSWTWTVFENDTNPPLEIVANPDPSGINTSATVAKFTALQSGQPFAGVESMHGADIGTFSLSPDNAFVTVWVWKSVISDVGVKFATGPGASTGEIKVPNTLINQWEQLVFDFTGVIDAPSSTDIDQIIVFPDFNARTSDNIIYFDSIEFSDGSTLGLLDTSENLVRSYPNPVNDFWNIQAKSIITEINIYSVLGQKVVTTTPNSTNYSLDLSNLKDGIYVVDVVSMSRHERIKLIKQ